MRRQALFLVFAVSGGVIAGALAALTWPWGGSGGVPSATLPANAATERGFDPSSAPDSGQLAVIVGSVARTLDDEINERRVLAEQLEQLRSEIRELRRGLGQNVEDPYQAEGQQDPAAIDEPQSMEERLAAAGITPQHLESIRRLQAEAQMATIELDDRARREGWVNTPRYFEEGRQLASGSTAIRNAIGDELYDQYLYATGMPNRLMVGSIIPSSPAEKAGFQRGDVILRYAGEQVYSNEELVALRSSGVRGEPVTVEILRGDQRLQLTMPRGPMGIGGAGATIDPATTRD